MSEIGETKAIQCLQEADAVSGDVEGQSMPFYWLARAAVFALLAIVAAIRSHE